ncbi:hypothetical protein ACFU98_35530 [Streptomyces sp. NPDC057575]|uniref:hypothetical protein n=1 Tax=unclassified Streptomyces TaxID=2593676 RepID=UPI003691520C
MDLVAPMAVANAVRELSEPFVPFVSVARDGDGKAGATSGPANRDWWQVRTTAQAGEQFPEHQRIDVAGRGEATVRMWLHPARRDLVIDTGAPGPLVLQYLVRYLRILLRLAHARGDEVFVHGGMVAENGRGVALIGAKRAGKTSTVMASMLAGRAFVANDDLSMARTGGGWTGRGWPRTVSVREDTFTALGLPSGHGPHEGARGASRSVRRVPGRDGGQDTVLLRPQELAELLDAPPPQPNAEVSVLLFPRFADSSADPTRLVPLAPPEAARRLAANLLPVLVKDQRFLRPHFPPGPDPRALGLAEQIAAVSPAYELVQHFSALREGALAVADLLSAPAETTRFRSIR